MKLDAPEWLLFALVIAAAAWLWPQLGLRRPLRATCALVLALILARPMARRAEDGMDLWVLVDRSASAAADMAQALPEWESIIRRAQGPSDRLHFVEYAASPTVRGEGEILPRDAQETRTGLAMEFTLTQLDRERLSRILLLSDGYATEPLSSVLEPLLKSGVPVDYRLTVSKVGADYRVASLAAPPRVQPGESFLVDARIVGTANAEFPCEIVRDGRKIGEATARVRDGEARLRFTDRLTAPGAHQYAVRILPPEDAHPENNEASAWVELFAGAHVLLVTAYEQDPVAEALTRQGFKVEQVSDPSRLHVGSLSGARLVILNNVPAHRLPAEFLRGLDFHVNEQGAGLLMAGGRFSFGSGGYFSSALDPLLPVSMELRKEHRRLRTAMAVVMDRSGSMGVTVSHGGRTVKKMDLANEGAARAVSLLGEMDLVSVVPVDSEAHLEIPLTEVGPARDDIINRTRRIQSQGGGIYVYEGLKAGWAELSKADAGQRHLILFADAADSEEPGDYRRLLEEMTSKGATVSVIGLGTERDSDAALLVDIATRGKGRVMFNANAAELPGLFAQETVAVARSAFIDEGAALKATPGWLEMAASPMRWLPKVDGYNLSYLKPGATAAAVSGDEYSAPLVAFWQRGLGRTAAVSFPLAGDFSQSARSWPQYSDLLGTLARWLSGEDAPAGLGLMTQISGTELGADLLYDGPEWAERIAASAPRFVVTGNEQKPEPRSIQWERLAPGRFHARVPLRPGERLRGAVQVGKVVLPFGPVSVGTNTEWQFRRESLAELQALSAATGGRERLDLAGSWETPPQPRFVDLRPWLLAVFLVLALADALATRMEFNSREWLRRRRPSEATV